MATVRIYRDRTYTHVYMLCFLGHFLAQLTTEYMFLYNVVVDLSKPEIAPICVLFLVTVMAASHK